MVVEEGRSLPFGGAADSGVLVGRRAGRDSGGAVGTPSLGEGLATPASILIHCAQLSRPLFKKNERLEVMGRDVFGGCVVFPSGCIIFLPPVQSV